MATIHAEKGKVMTLEIDFGESAAIRFKPDGANAHVGSKVIAFNVGTIALPTGGMALSVYLPPNSTYWQESHQRFILFHDVNEPKEITLDDDFKLVQFSIGERSGIVHP